MSAAPAFPPSYSPEAIQDQLALEERIEDWYGDPVAFAEEAYTRDPWGGPVKLDMVQRKILTYAGAHDRVAVRTCHGVGKTTCAAILTHWWLTTRRPSRVVTAAGTWNHLEEKLWPEIRLWSRTWRLRSGFDVQTMAIHGLDRNGEHHPGHRAVATSSDKAENVEGHHSPQLLLIIDEAKALPDAIYQGLIGMQPTKVVVLSTPPLIDAGWYCSLFGEKAEGWQTIHADAIDSDRVSPIWVDEMRRMFGETSAVYMAKVLGLIPESGTWALVPKTWAEAAMVRLPEADWKEAVLTCDVARFGDNLTTFGRFQHRKFNIDRWHGQTSIPRVARMCIEQARLFEAKNKGQAPGNFVIDDNGVGGGVTDLLREAQEAGRFPKATNIVPENFGAGANRDDKFLNRKAELWWEGRETLRNQEMALPTKAEIEALKLPRGHDFVSQLTSAVYDETFAGKIQVYDTHPGGNPTGVRREMFAHLTSTSPDLAHAYILGADLYRRLESKPPKDAPPAYGPAYAKALKDAKLALLRAKLESYKRRPPVKRPPSRLRRG